MKFTTTITFVQSLIVTAIVAVIALVLYPVFAPRKFSDHRHSDFTNVKTIGLGVQMYAADYDGALPNGISLANGPQGLDAPRYSQQLSVYLKAPDIFKSPEDHGIGTFDFEYAWKPNEFPTAFSAFGTSYYYTGGIYPRAATLSTYLHPESAAAVYTGSGAWIPNLKVNPVTLSLSQWSDTDFNQYKYIVEFYDWHAKMMTYHRLQSADPL